jgi:two-component system chemotaxis response regulator CheY
MPKMEGIDVLRNLREQGLATPVIMVTGEQDKEHVMEAVTAGATDYIMKPYSPGRVADRVKLVLDRTLTPPRPTNRRRALVADDSAVLRRLLAGILKDRCSFNEVVQAADGVQAVAAAAEGTFDVILLDWNMPNMKGIDALREIRAAGTKTPIIMVTSEMEGTRVVEAIDAGANSYIIKPFEPVTFADKVMQVLRLHG